VDRKFIAKLAPWPYGHRNEAIFDGLDDIIDDMVTEDFENTSSFGHVYTDDYTTASFQQEYGMFSLPGSAWTDYDRTSIWLHT
jgi:hypothetical protein